MTKVINKNIAECDIKRIGDYIAKDNPTRARSFIRELRMCISKLADFPERYQIDREVGDDIRRLTYRRYRIFYRYDQPRDTVHILRIIAPNYSVEDLSFDD